MSIKLSDELEARYALLTGYLLDNPNTVLKYGVLVELFGEDEARQMTTYLGRFFDSIYGMSQGKRRKIADTEHTIYFYLDQLCVPTGRSTFKGVLYRCAPGAYVYDPDATYKVGSGIKNNRHPIYVSASAITPPKASAPAAEPEPEGADDEQLELPFPAAGGAAKPFKNFELATAIIEADRENRLSERPPSEQSLPPLPMPPQTLFIPYPEDPNHARVLARGPETIVVETATEVITATIVVAVPR